MDLNMNSKNINIKPKKDTIICSYIGYETFSSQYSVSNSDLYVEIVLVKSNNEENSFSVSEKKLNNSLIEEPKNVRDINSLFSFNFNNLTNNPELDYALGAQIRYGNRIQLQSN